MRNKLLLFILIFSILTSSLAAQSNVQTAVLSSGEASLQVHNDIIISQPQNYFVTTAKQVSLLGACDPQYPLYMNGTQVNLTPHGYFAVYVSLKDGENLFVFTSRNTKKSVTIIHKAPKTVQINTAKVNEREAATWQKGHKPYYGIINRNNVTHRLQPDESNELLTPLVKGTAVNIIGETKEYYQLSDQTFVYKDSINLVEGSLPENQVTDIVTMPMTTDSCFELKLSMKRSCLYSLEANKEQAVLTLQDTVLAAQSKPITDIFEGCQLKVEQTGKNVVYTFYFNEKIHMSGSYVNFEDGCMILGFKKVPVLQEKGSLKGVTILLDAGHGDMDSGAIGPLRQKGPAEKDINLHIMQYAKDYLEKQGARVITIRQNDTFVPLADRVNMILAQKPDLSLSIHCNAMPVTADFSKVHGFLTFYTYEDNYQAAERINKFIAEQTGFKINAPRKSNLALTRITNCPALLLESSFLTNPEDFEWLSSSDNQKLLGEAIGKAASAYFDSLSF